MQASHHSFVGKRVACRVHWHGAWSTHSTVMAPVLRRAANLWWSQARATVTSAEILPSHTHNTKHERNMNSHHKVNEGEAQGAVPCINMALPLHRPSCRQA